MNNSTNSTTNTATTVYLPTLAEALRLPMDERTEKAMLLVEEGRVTLIDDHNAHVKSSTNNRRVYDLKGGICPCKDSEYRDTPDGCAHARAVRLQRALAQYQAVPPQDQPPPWGDDVDQSYDVAAAQEVYHDAIEDGKHRTPTAQEEAWNTVQRDFEKPAAPPEAPPEPPVPDATSGPESPARSKRKAEPKHAPSWRDKEPRFVHSLKWRDASGIEHMTVIRSDDWSDLQGDIAEASTFAMTNIAKPRTEAPTPQPAAQPEAPATPPAPREETTDDPAWCSMHQCEMRRHEKNGDVWYAHKSEVDDRWCRGRKKTKR